MFKPFEEKLIREIQSCTGLPYFYIKEFPIITFKKFMNDDDIIDISIITSRSRYYKYKTYKSYDW